MLNGVKYKSNMKITSVLPVLAFFILAIFNLAVGLKVSVYYEALCPDSVSFISRKLYPNFDQISNYVDLELVPYGKAIHNKRNGTWEFSCQHGPSECTGNKFQSCLLSLNNGTRTNVGIVNCIMRASNPAHFATVETCAQRYNVDTTKLRRCATSAEGDQLLASNGDKTWRVEPSISFVPTIVYDDNFDQLAQQQSLKDFVAVVCSKINGTKPTICDNRRLPIIRQYGLYW